MKETLAQKIAQNLQQNDFLFKYRIENIATGEITEAKYEPKFEETGNLTLAPAPGEGFRILLD